MPVRFHFTSELLESLSSGQGAKNDAGGKRSQIDPVNLNLVLDVELNMSLRFGQRQLPLRDVLELASGSVVELDREVDDPVELLLDGRVIARGEAVIVDGNYGLRVTEITEPITSNFVR
jgi:flagellar motor switch protein FliN/FliY